MTNRRSLAVLGLTVAACTPPTSASTPPPDAAAAASASTEPPRTAPAPSGSQATPLSPPAPSTFRAAIRRGQWQRAKALISELDAKERNGPELLFVQARIEEELGNLSAALEKLKDLESKLAILSTEISEQRARLQLEVGPFDAAARYFEKRADSHSLLNAARAWHKAKQPKKAVAALERALRRTRSARRRSAGPSNVEVAARALRAELAEAAGDKAAAAVHYKWLALTDPTASEARDADLAYERLTKKALSKAERKKRLQAFSDAADVEATERELVRLDGAPGAAVAKAELLRSRAFAYYKSRRDYSRAAELFQQSAKLGNEKDRPRDAYYAARALSRANRDDEAIVAFKKYVKQYPASGFAQTAYYLLGRIAYALGRYKEAVEAHDEYLKRYGRDKRRRHRGRYEEEARYERAIALLASEQFVAANKALEQLSKAERQERQKAQLEHLRGLALLGSKQIDAAKAVFLDVIKERPLSFAALASRARLKQLKVESVPVITEAKAKKAPAPLKIKLPQKVELLLRLGLDEEAEEHLRAQEASFKARYPKRGGEALCRGYGLMDVAERRYRIGQALIRGEALMRAPSSATRWAWECVYPRPFAGIVQEMAAKARLPSDLVFGLIRQESAFRTSARSAAQASGLMQLIEPTARRVAQDLDVDYADQLLAKPRTNVRFGTFYLSKLRGQFGERVALALSAYNAGPHATSRWLAAAESLPLDLWVYFIPYEETRQYVARVIGNWARYAYLSGGADAIPELELDIPTGLRISDTDY